MLIFDSFTYREQAEKFAKDVLDKHGLQAEVFDSQKESNAVDPFPFVLEAPIVLVQRANPSIEDEVIKLAKLHTGDFAGT